ncbi:MAG: hypothetical protein P4M13_04650 [Alphaproteobacteria bacterium]|nr:hypothetical protein [Alphaproteobacteria bacterium]
MKKITFFCTALALAALLALPTTPVAAQALTPSPCGTILCLGSSPGFSVSGQVPKLKRYGGQACRILTSGFFNISEEGPGATYAARLRYLKSGHSKTCPGANVTDKTSLTQDIAVIMEVCGSSPSYDSCTRP